MLLCRELLREPAWLVFDEPYEGLDSATRLVLAQELDRLVSASLTDTSATRVLIITDRYEHLPQGTTTSFTSKTARSRSPAVDSSSRRPAFRASSAGWAAKNRDARSSVGRNIGGARGN